MRAGTTTVMKVQEGEEDGYGATSKVLEVYETVARTTNAQHHPDN
jgi:hypothetical protein